MKTAKEWVDETSNVAQFDRVHSIEQAEDLVEAIQKDAIASQMNEQRAREILSIYDLSDNRIYSQEIQWPIAASLGGKHFVDMKGEFTADQLLAIAWWMRNMGAK